jgi:hypothetical protein
LDSTLLAAFRNVCEGLHRKFLRIFMIYTTSF